MRGSCSGPHERGYCGGPNEKMHKGKSTLKSGSAANLLPRIMVDDGKEKNIIQRSTVHRTIIVLPLNLRMWHDRPTSCPEPLKSKKKQLPSKSPFALLIFFFWE
jgi:hypothetical protein